MKSNCRKYYCNEINTACFPNKNGNSNSSSGSGSNSSGGGGGGDDDDCDDFLNRLLQWIHQAFGG
jgi:hypothetical protein